MGGGGDARSGVAAAIDRVEMAKYYAALELKPGATRGQVEKKYTELVERYAPEKHARDPEKHATALRLVQELTRAYRALLEKLQ
jgi:curved DNA-binding protein CbpA